MRVYWRSLFSGLQEFLAWQPWLVIAFFLGMREIITQIAHHYEYHIVPRFLRRGTHITVLVFESLVEGAVMGAVVLAFFVVFVDKMHTEWVFAACDFLLPAAEHGAIESVVIGLVLLAASQFRYARGLIEAVPSFKVFLETYLLFDFCRLELPHHPAIAGAMPAAGGVQGASGWARIPLHYAVGFFFVGLLVEWLLLAAERHCRSWLVELGLPVDRASRFTHWLTLAKGAVAGFLPVAMYSYLMTH
jgi:hypothetical protein